MKLHYGCGVATTAQVNRVSGDLAALEPKITTAAAHVSSVHATVVQGSNQTAALRAQVVELTAAAAALSALVQQLQANAAEPTGTGTIIAQELAALAAADTHTAQKLALLAAANQTAAQDIAALKAAKQQCTCGPELFAVDTTLTTIKAAQTANAAAVSLANATVESVKATITINAAATASVNTSLTSLAADFVNVSATVSATLSAINFTIYAKTADLANINAVSLGGVPAARYLRVRVVLYRESSTTRNGNLGGRSGADALCRASINRPAGLVQVHAFLSISSSDQIADFPTLYGVPSGQAIESLGGAVLARNFTSMLGSLSLSVLATGVLPTVSAFWSGTTTGGLVSTNTCSGFTSASSSRLGQVGISTLTDNGWLGSSQNNCLLPISFLCIAY
jgi:hypothetical protein